MLCITMGAPAGIGPEVTIKALKSIRSRYIGPIVIIGSQKLLTILNLSLEILGWELLEKEPVSYILKDTVTYFIDDFILSDSFEIKKDSKENGMASFSYIKTALMLINQFPRAAFITAPISKKSWQLAGKPYSGHTTMLQKFTCSKEVSMGFYTPELSVVLATVHIPFINISKVLNEKILRIACNHAVLLANKLGCMAPKVAVAGLNPHAGEGGLFGHEEIEVLKPLIKQFQAEGMLISGPYPADTIFWRAKQGEFDSVVSLYHDQGLIAVKTLAFDRAVNITLGLPFIRTSPDHGTAYEIAYTNVASELGMLNALNLAIKLQEIDAKKNTKKESVC